MSFVRWVRGKVSALARVLVPRELRCHPVRPPLIRREQMRCSLSLESLMRVSSSVIALIVVPALLRARAMPLRLVDRPARQQVTTVRFVSDLLRYAP